MTGKLKWKKGDIDLKISPDVAEIVIEGKHYPNDGGRITIAGQIEENQLLGVFKEKHLHLRIVFLGSGCVLAQVFTRLIDAKTVANELIESGLPLNAGSASEMADLSDGLTDGFMAFQELEGIAGDNYFTK